MLSIRRRTILIALLAGATVRAHTDDAARARHAFDVAASACAADAGVLWNASLCGPTLVADPATRTVFANEPGDGLRADGNIHVGTLPATIGIANTAVDWNDRRWLMLAAPLPDDDVALTTLALHESWHRIQDAIGLPAVDGVQAHLDEAHARVSLRLELRALRAAMTAGSDAERTAALSDALAFRASRHAAFRGSAASEARMELHEGLAEYTGRRLAGNFEPRLAQALADADRLGSYVRSFAYYTGPAYGALLDRVAPQWRRGLGPVDDLAQRAARAYGLEPRATAHVPAAVARRHGADAVRAEERARAAGAARELAAWRRRLVDGPVLIVPLTDASIVFDPREPRPLPSLGTIYPSVRVSGAWGVLETSHGALVASDWSTVRVALAPDQHTLRLADGWGLKVGPRPDDRHVVERAAKASD